jgi:hypothetical protein
MEYPGIVIKMIWHGYEILEPQDRSAAAAQQKLDHPKYQG